MLASTCRNSLKRSHPRIPLATSGLTTFCRPCRRYASTIAAQSDSHQLRHGPWQFQADPSFQQTQSRTNLQRLNLELGKAVERGRIIEAFDIAASMKADNVQPDITTYTYLMDGAARQALSLEAWAILEDMLFVGLQPDRTIFHHLIRAQRTRESIFMWRAVEEMRKAGVTPSSNTFTYIISHFAADGNLEMCLQYLKIMEDSELVPELSAIQNIINLAASLGYPRLALDTASSFEQSSIRRLDHEVWINCLISCVEALYADGTKHCWEVLTKELRITPDEGACIGVLHTAARHGIPDLAADVIPMLQRIGVELQEHHFAPLIESFCRANRISEALITLSIMRGSNIPIYDTTNLPIVTALGQDRDAIDAAWASIESLHKEGKRIDITALNSIIHACSLLGDMQRGIEFFKSFPDLDIPPNQDTFELLLQGCVIAKHRELGDRLLSDMKEAKIKPGAKTFENMTLLCLTQDTYEDAFFYLEETKAAGAFPTLAVYEALAMKCAENSDPRLPIVLEEMEENKLAQSPRLQEFLKRHRAGKRQSQDEDDQVDPVDVNPEVILDGAAQRFIESAGLLEDKMDRRTQEKQRDGGRRRR